MERRISVKTKINGQDSESFITKNKQRVKTMSGNVQWGGEFVGDMGLFNGRLAYVEDGVEFEIELYNANPYGRQLVKLEVQGVEFNSGIVLRPGERIFLERYLDDNSKFKFTTYTVENNDQTKKSTRFNGEIKVSFYNEVLPKPQSINTGFNQNSYPILGGYNPPYLGNVTNIAGQRIVGVGMTNMVNSTSNLINQTSLTSNSLFSATPTLDSIETGRVEKGDESGQQLITTHGEFEHMACRIDSWTLIPKSKNTIMSEDIVVYCTECGRKKKQKENYCPKCGNKL